MNRKTNYSQPQPLTLGKTRTIMNRKTHYSQPRPLTLGGKTQTTTMIGKTHYSQPTPLTIGGGKTQTTTMIGKTQGMIHSWMIQTLDLTMSCSPMIRPPLIHRRQRRTPPPGLRPSLRPKFQPNLQPNPPQDLLPTEV